MFIKSEISDVENSFFLHNFRIGDVLDEAVEKMMNEFDSVEKTKIFIWCFSLLFFRTAVWPFGNFVTVPDC